MSHCPTSRAKCKTPDANLAQKMQQQAGLNPAQIRVVLDQVVDYICNYYSELRPPGVVVHPAVSAREPAGKPVKCCDKVPVRLTMVHEADAAVLDECGTVELRAVRLYRMCCEAQEQKGLLSHEDLCLLLGINRSTVGDLIRRLHDQGLVAPTRGVVKDIGPGTSHKRQIAEMLARGESTSKISALTRHSEHAIGRYQYQFGLVVHLLLDRPDATDEERRQIAGLSEAAYEAYLDAYRAVADRDDCRPHLERLRRRYQMDTKRIADRIPPGKTPPDLATRRLHDHTLPNAVRQTVQHDLGTTRRVAEVVSDDIMTLLDRSLPSADALLPGEAVVFVDAHDPDLISGEAVADRDVIPVAIPLYTEDVQQTWRSDGSASVRRAKIATHIATAAYHQGGIMSVAKLAELLHVQPSTMSQDLRNLAVEVHNRAPTKGLIEDAGPTVTHKAWIVDLDQHGLTGEEISWLTRHAPMSRDRYIETYRRAETLMRVMGRIPEPEYLARVLRLRLHVARQYRDLLESYHGDGECIRDSAHPA